MENGLHEWPLVLFTVLAQSAVGAFLALSIRLIFNQKNANRLHYAMVALWGLMAVGFMFSTMHLGSPERALNALNRLGHSDLSNEIATGSLFFALGGIYWLFAVSHYLQKDQKKLPLVSVLARIEGKFPRYWQGIGRLCVVLAGLLFMVAMAKLYMIPTVPTWNSLYTPLSFFSTVWVSGFALAVVLLHFAENKPATSPLFIAFVGVGGVFAGLLAIGQYHFFAEIHTAIFSALERVPDFVPAMVGRFGIFVVGCGLLWFGSKQQRFFTTLLGFLLIFSGELIARTLFYATHMTIGLKALGG